MNVGVMISKKITAFLPYNGYDYTKRTVMQMRESDFVDKIYLVTTNEDLTELPDTELLKVSGLASSEAHKLYAEKTETEFILLMQKDTEYSFGQFGIENDYFLSS